MKRFVCYGRKREASGTRAEEEGQLFLFLPELPGFHSSIWFQSLLVKSNDGDLGKNKLAQIIFSLAFITLMHSLPISLMARLHTMIWLYFRYLINNVL